MNILEILYTVSGQLFLYHTFYGVFTIPVLVVFFLIGWKLAQKKILGVKPLQGGVFGVVFFEMLFIGYLVLQFMGNVSTSRFEKDICSQVNQKAPSEIVIKGNVYEKLHSGSFCGSGYYADTLEELRDPDHFQLIGTLETGKVYFNRKIYGHENDVYLFVNGVERKKLAHLELYRLVEDTTN